MRRPVIVALFLAAILIISALALGSLLRNQSAAAGVTAAGVPPGAPLAAANPSISLIPSSKSVVVGQVFPVPITIDTGGQPVDGVQAFLDFNRSVLQVCDQFGNPASSISVGGAFEVTLLNSASNAAGQITFAAGQLTTPPLTGSFTAATIYLKALAPTASTTVQFSLSAPRQTKLTSAGGNVLQSANGGAYTITSSGSITPIATATSRLSLPVILATY